MVFAENKLTRTFSPFQRLKDRSAIGFIIMLFGVLWMTPVQAGTNNNSAPLMTVNTIAFDSASKQGIAVGLNRFCGDAADAPKCFYENPGQSSDVQMLVLDRTTVQPISFTGAPDGNLNFSTDASGLTSLNSALVSLKATSPDNVLVILAYDSTDCVDFSLIIDGLQAIGQQRIPPECRPWSIIGVPGMVAGNAAINIDTVINNSATGGLKGYLREAALVRNGIEYLGRIFDFGYAEGYTVTPVSKPANYQQASIQLGSTTLKPPSYSSTESAGGFFVVLFDTRTLDVDANGNGPYGVFVSNGTGCVDFATLNEYLSQAVPPSTTGVAFTSLGQAWSTSSGNGGCSSSDFTDVLETLGQLGVNPDIFARAVKTNLVSPYSMISANGYFGERLAYEASGVITDWVATQTGETTAAQKMPQAKGILSGALNRSNQRGTIYPQTGDPAGYSQPELEIIFYQDEVPWPLTPAAGATASAAETAFAWVAHDTQGIGSASDWTNGKPSSNSVVRNTALQLREEYPKTDSGLDLITTTPTAPTGAPFTPADVNSAVTQVNLEINYRKNVMKMFTTVVTPVVDNQSALASQLQTVADTITGQALSADEEKLTYNSSYWGSSMFLHAVSGLKSVINAFQEFADDSVALKAAYGLVSVAGGGFQFIMGATAGPPAATLIENYLVLESQLSEDTDEVKQQVEDAITQWRLSMGTSQSVVLSDWGKMGAVEAKLVNNGPWEFTPDQIAFMSNAWNVSVRQQTYYAYWPKLYNLGAARLSSDGHAPAVSGSGSWNCFGQYCANSADGEYGNAYIYPFVKNGGLTFQGIKDQNSSTDVPGTGTDGIGDGPTYLPLYDIFNNDPATLVVYMFEEGWDLDMLGKDSNHNYYCADEDPGTKGAGYEKIIGTDLMTSIAEQITFSTKNDSAGNFYPPTFWFNARASQQLVCSDTSGTNVNLQANGFYADPGGASGASVTQVMNADEFQTGDHLSVGVSVKNVVGQSDFFMATLLPDGNTLFFLTDLDPMTIRQGAMDDPRSFQPLSDGSIIPTGVSAFLPDLFSYTFIGLEDSGTYRLFSALSRPDAFKDGSVDPGDFISVDSDPFTFNGSEALNE